jgi:hypothetical protein
MSFVRHFAAAAALTALAACAGDISGTDQGVATFTVQVGSEQFAVRVADQATYERLSARLASGVTGVIMGRVAAGDGGFNGPWNWHLVPSTVTTADVAIELCDGTPSYVAAHRDEWIRDVKNYCPWGAKVIAVGP